MEGSRGGRGRMEGGGEQRWRRAEDGGRRVEGGGEQRWRRQGSRVVRPRQLEVGGNWLVEQEGRDAVRSVVEGGGVTPVEEQDERWRCSGGTKREVAVQRRNKTRGGVQCGERWGAVRSPHLSPQSSVLTSPPVARQRRPSCRIAVSYIHITARRTDSISPLSALPERGPHLCSPSAHPLAAPSQAEPSFPSPSFC